MIKTINTILKKIQDQTNGNTRLFIIGNNQKLYAELAKILIKLKYQIVLVPQESLLPKFSELIVQKSLIRIYCVKANSVVNLKDWILGLYTSGTSGQPKLFGFSASKISKTLSWYKKIYNPNINTIIITALLPACYNFPFIAGILLSDYIKCRYIYMDDIHYMLKRIESYLLNGKHIILLANPIVMDIVSVYSPKYNLNGLNVDCGGASISTVALEWFRNQGINIREGWGVTETCSLTHFDIEGTKESLGTVGKNMPGVDTKIVMQNSIPYIYVKSPNAGIRLDSSGEVLERGNSYINSGSIGKIDSQKRLTILGRPTDTKINDYWPKDTLEIIAQILGPRSATIVHLNSEVWVIMRQKLTETERSAIKYRVSQKLNIDVNQVLIKDCYTEMTTSIKIRENYL